MFPEHKIFHSAHRSVILVELSHAELVLGRQLNVVGGVRIEVTHHETRGVRRYFLSEEVSPGVVVRPAVLQRNVGKMLRACRIGRRIATSDIIGNRNLRSACNLSRASSNR